MTRPKPELLRECERVNQLLKKEAEKLELGTKKSLARMDEARQCSQKDFYDWAVLEFQEYVRRQLEIRPTVSKAAMINNGARKLKVSNATTTRYMATLRAKGGPFNSLGDILMLNPNYTEQDDYWLDNQEQEDGNE